MGKQLMNTRKSSEIIDIVSYALEMSANGIPCVFVVHFWLKNTFKVCKLA